MPLVSYVMLSSSQESSSSGGGDSFCVAGNDGCGGSNGCVRVLQGGALDMERVDTGRVGICFKRHRRRRDVESFTEFIQISGL